MATLRAPAGGRHMDIALADTPDTGGDIGVTLSRLRLIGGRASHGGALSIDEAAVVVLADSEVIANEVQGVEPVDGAGDGVDRFGKGGGAIYNAGDLTIRRSTFAMNRSGVHGGVIDNRGQLSVVDSVFGSDTGLTNYLDGTKGADEFAYEVTGTNDAEGDGGVIANFGVLEVDSSQFVYNDARGDGGQSGMPAIFR